LAETRLAESICPRDCPISIFFLFISTRFCTFDRASRTNKSSLDCQRGVNGERDLGGKAPSKETYSKGPKNYYEKTSLNRVRLTRPDHFCSMLCTSPIPCRKFRHRHGYTDCRSTVDHKNWVRVRLTLSPIVSPIKPFRRIISLLAITNKFGFNIQPFRCCADVRNEQFVTVLTPTRCSFSHWNISQLTQIHDFRRFWKTVFVDFRVFGKVFIWSIQSFGFIPYFKL